MAKRDLVLRDRREISPGIWRDPISEARHDYDGSQAAFEAAIAQTKSLYDTITGGNNSAQSLDLIWDSALEIAAHIVETEPSDGSTRARMVAKIRAMKREK